MKCLVCKKEIANNSHFCEYCGARVHAKKHVTVLGYMEYFPVEFFHLKPPVVKVYKNGVEVSKVSKNEKVELEMDYPCELYFKCHNTSVICVVKPGDWIFLMRNSWSGNLDAVYTDEDNYKTLVQIHTKKVRTQSLVTKALMSVLIVMWIILLFLPLLPWLS